MNSKITSSNLILSLFLIAFFCQSNLVAQNQAKPVDKLNGKDTLLCREWKFVGSEEFGVMKSPKDKQKNDESSFTFDRKLKLMLDGESKSGSYFTDRGKNILIMTIDGSAMKRNNRILSLSKDSLVLEYKDSTLVKTRFLYVPKK